MNDSIQWIWVFKGEKGTFPSGVFASRSSAIDWIKNRSLSGTLTRYPVGISVYDWAVDSGHFIPKTKAQQSPQFVGSFSSAYLEHYHFQSGIEVGEAQ